MISLYYQPPSASVVSSIDVVYLDTTSPEYYVQTYSDITIVTGSGVYNLYTGSIVAATFPIENTVVYYSASFIQPPSAPNLPTQSTYLVRYNFIPDTTITSSANTFTISGSEYVDNLSQSFDVKGTLLNTNTDYLVTLSGSGLFYTSSITITNSYTGITAAYITSSNNYISTSISSSTYINNFNIVAQTETLPYIRTVFSSSASVPVSPTSSLSAWNTYLNVTASLVSSSGNIFYIVGGNLSTVGTISITGSGLNDFYSFKTTDLISCSFYNNRLTNYPNSLLSAFNLVYLNLDTNLITGSLPDLSNNDSLLTFIASNNSISGSIPNPSSSYSLQRYDVKNNYLTGGIDLSRCFNLQYFDASNNNLSGSFTLLDGVAYENIGNIQHLDVNSNYLSGEVDISDLTNLRYLDISNNRFTGSVTSFGNWSLQHFNCSNNLLSGSFPILQTIELEYAPVSSLQYFNIGSNNFNGTIDVTDHRPSLQTLICNDNKLTDYISLYSTYSSSFQSLTYFNATNNLLSSSAVDNILRDLDISGLINGTASLAGTGNGSPSGTGYLYTASLKTKGWIVSTN